MSSNNAGGQQQPPQPPQSQSLQMQQLQLQAQQAQQALHTAQQQARGSHLDLGRAPYVCMVLNILTKYPSLAADAARHTSPSQYVVPPPRDDAAWDDAAPHHGTRRWRECHASHVHGVRPAVLERGTSEFKLRSDSSDSNYVLKSSNCSNFVQNGTPSRFEMCFAIGSHHRYVPGGSNQITNSNPESEIKIR